MKRRYIGPYIYISELSVMTFHDVAGTLDGTLKWLVDARSIIECMATCNHICMCEGANWQKSNKICELVADPVQTASTTAGIKSFIYILS